jgi:hypothetical protein
MGGAFVGLADDASAIYWNPAGVADIDRTELSFMHLSWFQDISYEHFALAQPLGRWGVWGWSIAYLHMDKLEGRDQQGEPTSDFTSSDMAITLCLGHRITADLSFGVSIKHIHEKIEEENANALAFDLGCLYQTPLDDLFLGGSIQNLGQGIKFVKETCKLPTTLKLGTSYRYSLAKNPMNFVLDIYLSQNNQTSLHLGTEYIYRNMIAGRIGYKDHSDLGNDSNFSFGLGILATRSQTYRLDYAFEPQGILGASHTFSLLIRL